MGERSAFDREQDRERTAALAASTTETTRHERERAGTASRPGTRFETVAEQGAPAWV